MRILVADDDPVSRRLIEHILVKSGYEVVSVDNGAQALHELSQTEGPRLALLDWMMPRLDGLEVCRSVRSRTGQPYVYITMLTSKLSADDVIAGLEAGSDDYVTKPCNPQELTARLRTGQRILRLEDSLVAARDEMRFKATHDTLTGLLNHGAILGVLASEINRASREHSPLSLLLCDLDHFKRVNDFHGHLAGDNVLRQVAARLKDAVRPDDVVGRYGGEEFLILLKGCTCARLHERAEEVRQAIASKPFSIDGMDLSVSLSVGALTVNGCTPDVPVEPLLRNVDSALYRAKSGGRNRIVHSVTPPGEEGVFTVETPKPAVQFAADRLWLSPENAIDHTGGGIITR